MEEDILPTVISEIEKYFHFLFERGFKIQSKTYYPQAFGDWEIVLESPSCQIRIGTDRGEVILGFLPLKAHSNFAVGLRAAIYFLSRGEQYIGVYKGNILDSEKQLEMYANLLEKHLDQILPLFGDGHEKYREDLLIAQQKVNDLKGEELRPKNLELIRISEERNRALKESLKHQKPNS